MKCVVVTGRELASDWCFIVWSLGCRGVSVGPRGECEYVEQCVLYDTYFHVQYEITSVHLLCPLCTLGRAYGPDECLLS